MQKYCIFCGKLLDERAIFCHSCGKRQADSTDISSEDKEINVNQNFSSEYCEVQEDITQKESKNKKKNFIVSLVRNSILLAVAITVFALSFAPIFNWDLSNYMDDYIDDNLDLSLSHSAIDGMIYLFDSIQDYENENESPLYDKLNEIGDDIFEDIKGIDDIDNLSSREKKRIENNLEKAAILSYRLALQTEGEKTNFPQIIIAIVSILYILFSFTLLVFSIINFISSFGLLKNKGKNLYKVTLSLLCAIPSLILITYTVFFTYMNALGCTRVVMGSGAITIFVISIITIISLITLSFIFDSRKVKVSNIVLRSVSSILAILVICMCFTPIFTTSVKTVFEGRENKSVAKIPIHISLFQEFLLNESEIDSISTLQNYSEVGKMIYFKEQFEMFETYSKSDINKGFADSHNGQYLIELLAVSSEYDFGLLISVIGLFFILTVLSVGLLLQQNLSYFTGCKYIHVLARIAKILTLILAALAFISTIAVFIGTGICVTAFAPSGYAIGLGAGLFFLLIFAIAVCCIPTRIKNEN